MLWTSIVCIIFLSAVSCNPIVNITKGSIRGRVLKSRNGRDYFSFTGVPYAKPPIDELRFEPPVPVDSWADILDGTKEPNMCLQKNIIFFYHNYGVIKGSEDCLYLNVYTPDINNKLPVMVWIHGGAYLIGHGGQSYYGPDYFMDKDVVFVSLNYRLGLFGFLSLEDDTMPGNYGMKDQVMALRWVQENIAKFGGDPGHVTIFGESAGGASVGLHMLSPMSKGLFHKAILQSGAPLCHWTVTKPGIIRKRTEAAATISGCPTDNSEEILNCFKKLPSKFIVDINERFHMWSNHPSIAFHPVVESCDSNQEAFLCNHPITDFKQESNVPSIIGLTSGEGGIYVSNLFNDTSLQFPELHAEFNSVLALMLFYKHSVLPEHLDEIGDQVMKMYFPSGRIDDNTHSNAVDMFGDGLFTFCIMDMAVKISSPTYFYLFDYQNEFSFNQLYGKCEKPLGVSHADDITSLFKLSVLNPQGLNDRDSELSKIMIDIWVKFASSETPTVDGTDNGTAWTTFTSIEESSVLHIDSVQPKIKKNVLADKYKFWSGLPLWSRFDKLLSSKTSNYIKNEL